MTIFNCSLAPDSVSRIHDLLICLAKFGETVGIEVRPEKFTFTALNASRTAYAAFSLDATSFFTSYDFDGQGSRTPGRFTCQLSNKANCQTLLSAFRSRLAENRNADIPIERCDITVEEDADVTECRMVVAIICKHGLSKIYRLTYEAVEIMHALFDKSSASNSWKISARIMREYIEYFGPRTEQLDMLAKDGKAIFTSFTEKIMDGKEILKQPLETAISIHIQDFEDFAFDEDMHIVISVKDFKAIVTHAETLRTTIIASFSRPSRPLQFAYDASGIHCEFTLMTTGDYRAGTAPPTPRPVATATVPSQSVSVAPIASPPKRVTDMPPPARPVSISSQLQKKPMAALKRGGISLTSQQSQGSDSLFVPNNMDDDRRWEPLDYENDDGGDMLGWDASGEMNSGFQPTLRDSGSYAPSNGPDKSFDDGKSQELAATQRLSQLHGLFD
ncbi:DNA repair protein Rad9 [Myriangium duriaei CBS 260.36]|uniref:DNA repair protein Rad9 n=1 Tax=Myriangium duriaei CBS 260.36 TaxID=1168546 RepID=A0A9P4ISR2_9PEZI|nr:DNA repair protein Rad9 [Myriangium duriaei CBS 260.36]